MKESAKGCMNVINKQIRELVGVYRDACKHMKLSENEFWVWYTLVAMEGPHTQQEICAMWSLPKQTVNTVIAHMRLKRYAYLEAIPGTRNHKIIRLTPEGRKIGEALVGPISQAEERAVAKITPEERAMVTGVMDKYIRMFREELDNCAECEGMVNPCD